MPTILPVRLNLSAAAAELPAVRLTLIPRHACVLAAAVTAGVLCAAAPAAADVTVSPSTAAQGEGSNLTMHVVNDHKTAAITKIRLVLPAATPVAEVYPLSVDDWAPTITNRPLNPPMQGMHGGTPLTEATGSITWTAAPGKALLPGKAADVKIAIGPLPTTDLMTFEVQATYADGSAGPTIAPVALTLTPAPAGLVEEPFLDEPVPDDPADDGGPWGAVGWLIALIAAAVAAVAVIRSRRVVGPGTDRDAGSDAPADAEAEQADRQADEQADATPGNDPQDSTHRARVSAWSYRDGP
jgi:hypothetical protein